jgi:HlyD family secretion protein
MKSDELNKLRIPKSQRTGKGIPAVIIYATVALALVVGVYLAWPRASDSQRVVNSTKPYVDPKAATPRPASTAQAATPPPADGEVVLTTSGYIINRERIELSPRFVGVVKWIGLKKGDPVKKDQVVVLLEDSEQKARLVEAEGRLARAKSALTISNTRYKRLLKLREQRVESEQQFDDAQAEFEGATAGLSEAQGLLDFAKSQFEWTIIRSPIDGVVLEKLADENELVSPQSFGGDRGPSTALLAVADPKDLQVEIDLNESDISKVYLGQKCRVSPEAYPDRFYGGHVAEIAPEANRQKGTLQVKVQIEDPDNFLIPELSAKVDFGASRRPTSSSSNPPAESGAAPVGR